MVLGIGGTLANPAVAVSSLPWIAVAVMVGGLIGVPLSKVPLTAVPQRTALSHAFGGLAAGLVGTAKYYLWLHEGGANTPRSACLPSRRRSSSVFSLSPAA